MMLILMFIDSYMKYTDKRIFILNDFRLSYNKTIIRNIHKNNKPTSPYIMDGGCMIYNLLYKIDKDVLSIEIEDNGNFLM